jgi:hypothetical protein
LTRTDVGDVRHLQPHAGDAVEDGHRSDEAAIRLDGGGVGANQQIGGVGVRGETGVGGGPCLCEGRVEGGPHRGDQSVAVVVQAGRSVAGEPGVAVIPDPDDVGLGGAAGSGDT